MVLIPEWLAVLMMVCMFLYGFTLGHALNNQQDPFWRSFMDGLALRRFWDKAFRKQKMSRSNDD
jgi:hypothetical protein